MLLLSKASVAHERQKIYFLADTISVSKQNRFFEMGTEGKNLSYISFYCKCIPPYERFLAFTYRNDLQPHNAITTIPDVSFLTWKELLDIVIKLQDKFDAKYDLYIVEVLPGKLYSTNKVRLVRYRDRSDR